MKPLFKILFVLLLFTSCKKFLDVKPKGMFIPETIGDFDPLLDNSNIVNWIFWDNNIGSSLAFLTDNLELSEGIGKIYYKANNHPNIDRYYAYIFREPYKNPNFMDYFWDWGTYRPMAYFNTVIEGVQKLKNAGNEADANRVIAQALVNRAWSYFHTTLVYGPVYKPGADNSTKTIPYVTSSDVLAPMVDLSTQEEVFTKVLHDLHTALPNVPTVTNYTYRPNKAATYTMLAYVHLFTRNFDSVVYYANLAWTTATGGNADKVLYDFNTLSFTQPADPLNSTIRSPDNLINAPNARETLLFRRADFAGVYLSSYPSAEFIGLFDTAKDLRYKYWFAAAPGYKTTSNGVTYDDGKRVQYYRGVKTAVSSGFSYPELLLMRAEGYARTNRLAEAIADLNTLRKYRYVTGTAPLTAGTQDEVISQVLEERRRELPLGHIKRFLDLKRLVLDAGKPWAKIKITHKLGTETFEGIIDSKTFILPISNTVLVHNPQWGIPLDERPFN